MAFLDVVKNGAKKLFSRGGEGDEEVPDDETRDKQLRSLRRQRRIQMEEFEKEQLQKEIKEHQKMRMREAYFSPHKSERMMKEDKPLLKSGTKIKRVKPLSNSDSLFRAKAKLKKRAARKGMLSKQSGMLK